MINDQDLPQLIKYLSQDDIRHAINAQVAIANYLLPPNEEHVGVPDKAFSDNAELWNTILNERVRANTVLTLNNFSLFEWFPRSPGLFFTPAAERSRRIANQYIEEVRDGIVVLNPYGKIEMLKGGVGCVRLKPKQVGRDVLWFMSASANGVAHEGIPIALPQYWYERYIDEIATMGASTCNIVGKLQFVPDSLVKLFEDYAGVPQLYLLVEEIHRTNQRSNPLHNRKYVSVAVTFQSNYEGHHNFYASYVTFVPGEGGSFFRAIDWLENTYVRSRYRGNIVTDFDEQTRRFAGAIFSLEKIMNNTLNKSEVKNFLKIFHVYGANPNFLFESLEKAHIVDQSINYGHRVNAQNVSGQIAVGENISQAKKSSDYRNPWITGSFYLAALLAVGALLLVAGNVIPLYIFPMVLIGSLLGVSVIGAFQLRNDRSLSEENFLKLMALTFRQLPFIRKRNTDDKP